MNRLFTFGCSFTQYNWPTWADIIGQSFDHYENWGKCGIGNYVISSRILECDHVNKINENDTVLVMFTSVPRIDIYNNMWYPNGNILQARLYDYEKRWVENNWSAEQAYYTTWMAIRGTKYLLEQLGCNYKIMKAFNITTYENTDDVSFENILERVDGHYYNFYKEYNNDINQYFDIDISMTEWRERDINYENKTWRNSTNNCYTFKKWQRETNWVDYHPTIRIHEAWCKEMLPELYTNHVDVDNLESFINYDNMHHVSINSFLPIKFNKPTMYLE